MAALSLARDWNLTTIVTTRNPAKPGLLTERGADDVLVDTGQDAFKGLAADYVLDLIGAHSALGSLYLVKPGGTVCVVGMPSYDWVIEAFEPVAMIPSGAKLAAARPAAAPAHRLQFVVICIRLYTRLERALRRVGAVRVCLEVRIARRDQRGGQSGRMSRPAGPGKTRQSWRSARRCGAAVTAGPGMGPAAAGQSARGSNGSCRGRSHRVPVGGRGLVV